MRYFNVNERPFTRVITNTPQILKDSITIPAQDFFSTLGIYQILGKEQLDSIAQSIYGLNNEYRWYLLFYRNAREIVGWKARFDHIKKLQVANPSEYP